LFLNGWSLIIRGKQFLEAIASDWKLNQLDQYEISFEELFNQLIKRRRFTL
jgi:hypothetical protein